MIGNLVSSIITWSTRRRDNNAQLVNLRERERETPPFISLRYNFLPLPPSPLGEINDALHDRHSLGCQKALDHKGGWRGEK